MEVVPCFVELLLPYFELFMCLLHIHPVIFVWSTCYHGYEIFLALNLLFDVGVCKEW